jgi:hypothetical protein
MSNVTPIHRTKINAATELSIPRTPNIWLNLTMAPNGELAASLVMTDLPTELGLATCLVCATAPLGQVRLCTDLSPATLDVGEAMFVLLDSMAPQVERYLREVKA